MLMFMSMLTFVLMLRLILMYLTFGLTPFCHVCQCLTQDIFGDRQHLTIGLFPPPTQNRFPVSTICLLGCRPDKGTFHSPFSPHPASHPSSNLSVVSTPGSPPSSSQHARATPSYHLTAHRSTANSTLNPTHPGRTHP